MDMVLELKHALYLNLIKDARYLYILNGLKNTLVITFFAVLIGIFFGFLIAFIRNFCDNTGKLKLLNRLAKFFVVIIRGTPIVVQLMILFFCVFSSRSANNILIAIIGFGINSTAYVSEIFRAGLNSVDRGQIEAGRSLGLNYFSCMRYIILPQAFKNILPALCNEFVSLLKETSVAGYVAVQDLTKAGDIIKSRTYDAWTPLILIALIYLVLTYCLTCLANFLERRLKRHERR